MDQAGFTAELSARDSELREAVTSSTLASKLLDRLQSHAKTVDVDGQAYYLVEGDLLLDDAQLVAYAGQQAARIRQGQATARAQQFGYAPIVDEQPSALVGMKIGDQLVRWAEGLVLTYCVLRDTFLSPQDYQTVVANMAQATGEWEGICGVKFQHRQDFDGYQGTDNPNPAEVLFIARGFDAGGEFYASSFFPIDPVFRRWVLIDPTYFGNHQYDKVGVLRHELGHVLGFRHEHIRPDAPPGCPDEDPIYEGSVAFDLTPYDPRSVMHYFCGGRGNPALALTTSDRDGAQRVYGPPRTSVRFIG